jgi:hypothetical protein
MCNFNFSCSPSSTFCVSQSRAIICTSLTSSCAEHRRTQSPSNDAHIHSYNPLLAHTIFHIPAPQGHTQSVSITPTHHILVLYIVVHDAWVFHTHTHCHVCNLCQSSQSVPHMLVTLTLSHLSSLSILAVSHTHARTHTHTLTSECPVLFSFLVRLGV